MGLSGLFPGVQAPLRQLLLLHLAPLCFPLPRCALRSKRRVCEPGVGLVATAVKVIE
jgi:hypothetical protein